MISTTVDYSIMGLLRACALERAHLCGNALHPGLALRKTPQLVPAMQTGVVYERTKTPLAPGPRHRVNLLAGCYKCG